MSLTKKSVQKIKDAIDNRKIEHRKEIEFLEECIEVLQNTCEHKEKIFHSAQYDSYHECIDCGKQF